MKRVLKLCVAVLLLALMLTSQASICFADGETGKITVTLEDKDKNKLDGVKVNICQVAELSGMGYFPTADFEDSGISLSGIINDPSELTAKTLVAYIRKNGFDKAVFPFCQPTVICCCIITIIIAELWRDGNFTIRDIILRKTAKRIFTACQNDFPVTRNRKE